MKKVRILALDGGGMRGIIQGVILNYIEQQLQQKTGNSRARIADYFDLIAGTGSGGILTCMYLTPAENRENESAHSRYSAQEALDFYLQEGFRIFNGSRKSRLERMREGSHGAKYRADYLERVLNDRFGNILMSDLLKPCLITTYNLKTESSFFFSSVEPADARREFYVKDAARSTSAAPAYFSPAIISNQITREKMITIDGALVANNPAMCAYAEARKIKFPDRLKNCRSAKDMLMLSIGGGGGNGHLSEEDYSGRRSINNWMEYLPEIIMHGGVNPVSYQLSEIFGMLDKPEDQLCYKRINVPMHARDYSADMADASSQNIRRLLIAGQKTLSYANGEENGHSLDEFIDLLIA